jgi:hypothetical protein
LSVYITSLTHLVLPFNRMSVKRRPNFTGKYNTLIGALGIWMKMLRAKYNIQTLTVAPFMKILNNAIRNRGENADRRKALRCLHTSLEHDSTTVQTGLAAETLS